MCRTDTAASLLHNVHWQLIIVLSRPCPIRVAVASCVGGAKYFCHFKDAALYDLINGQYRIPSARLSFLFWGFFLLLFLQHSINFADPLAVGHPPPFLCFCFGSFPVEGVRWL